MVWNNDKSTIFGLIAFYSKVGELIEKWVKRFRFGNDRFLRILFLVKKCRRALRLYKVFGLTETFARPTVSTVKAIEMARINPVM